MRKYQKKRTTAEQARRLAEALKRRQSAVNITASAAKPAEALDVFKNRFDDLEKLKARVCTVEEAMPKLKATVQKSASDSESKSEFPELAKTLMASMSAFKKTLDAANAESPRKNDSGADIDKTTVSKQTQKRLRHGAMATETTANANHTTKATTTHMGKAQKPITLNTAAKPPNTDPPASTDESDQETEKWRKQKQRNVHHTNANGAPRSGHVGKPTTQDGKTVAKRGGFKRGRGRGFARGHGPPRV
jgi:Sec-independent protein translocase protein TatA